MSQSPGPRPHESPLMRVFQLASGLGAAGVADEAFDLADRVADGRFFCAVLGQQKRGKSAFLNALLGEAILPTGVAPVTTAVTVISHGKQRSARVRFLDGNVLPIAPGKLKDYATAAENPGNTRQVALIELSWPSPLLATGLCLVDTPGLGSLLAESAGAARRLVPQVDVAILLLGADPPLSELELALAEELSGQSTKTFFVLNKADRAPNPELAEAKEFTLKTLGQKLWQELRLYEVSAAERLQGRPTRQWSQLEEDLMLLAEGSAQALVAQSQARGMKRFVHQLQSEIEGRLADSKLEAKEAQRLRDLLPELAQLLHSVAALPDGSQPAGAATAAAVAALPPAIPSRRPPQAIPPGGMPSDLAVRVGPRKPTLSKMGVPALDVPVPRGKK